MLDAVLDVMRFWLDLGVDALRLDAIPYLIEREGTINENLPETHAILKPIRRELDARYQGRVLLAEANQWPSDVRAYFGDGDECHMAFHFPLMPRMFMALRQEERHPIVEIMNQTPEIPETCQWAIFLRNHDELTLEMVTDEERDYMYAQYAADPQMRLNVGIRRRLAPLMENSRPRIELMNSLLFSMPGTPIIYYGDEIGMGDNVYLGDRNGVRTPMQWSSDRNAGFSRADPARLYFPVIMDPVYGYEAINVEAQERSPFSLLHWMKRMIALRRQHPVFGRGSIEFIRDRQPQGARPTSAATSSDIVLCVANLVAHGPAGRDSAARSSPGSRRSRCSGQTEFPRIGDQPYFLTLAPYGFYWFQLQEVVVPVTSRTAPVPEEHAALPALFAGVVWDSMLDGSAADASSSGRRSCRSCSGSAGSAARRAPLAAARFVDWTTLRRGAAPGVSHHRRSRVPRRRPRAVRRCRWRCRAGAEADGDRARARSTAVLARITGARKGLLYDGLFDDGTCQMLLAAIQERQDLAMRHGSSAGTRPRAAAAVARRPTRCMPIVRSAPDQSNTSVLFGKHV